MGIRLDDRLNFSPHINNICNSVTNQLNALIRLQKFLSFKEKKILINSRFISKINHCPLGWMFSSAVSLKKIQNLQKRALKVLYKSYNTSNEGLLLKSGSSSMNIKRPRGICIENLKTLNNLNPSFMKEIFSLRQTIRPVRKNVI